MHLMMSCLLKMKMLVTIHVGNLQMLMIEVYQSFNHQNPSFLWELFARKEINYNLRIKDILALPKALTTSFGIDPISFRGSILWNGAPDVIKSSNAVFAFMKNIKNWSGEVCTCSICLYTLISSLFISDIVQFRML